MHSKEKPVFEDDGIRLKTPAGEQERGGGRNGLGENQRGRDRERECGRVEHKHVKRRRSSGVGEKRVAQRVAELRD